MAAVTTIRIDHAALPEHLDRSRPDSVAGAIEAGLRDAGITAEASDVTSHIKIEMPTNQLAAASTMLASLQFIRGRDDEHGRADRHSDRTRRMGPCLSAF